MSGLRIRRLASSTGTSTQDFVVTKRVTVNDLDVDTQRLSAANRLEITLASQESEEQLPMFEIDRVYIGLYDPKDLATISVITVQSPELSGKGTVNDPRMGVTEIGKFCATCGKDSMGCPGHVGRIALNQKIVHPLYVDITIYVCQCVCNSCGKLKLSKENLVNMGIMKYSGTNRIKMIAEKSAGIGCTHSHDTGGGSIKCVPDPEYLSKKSKESGKILCQFKMIGDKSKKGSGSTIERTPDFLLKLFSVISDEDVKLLGFDNGTHPKFMIMESFPVIPPASRPPTVQDGSKYPHQLTYLYTEIIKRNNMLMEVNDDSLRQKLISEIINNIKYFMDSGQGKSNSSQRKDAAGIKQMVQSKTGIIRQNLMGKRVDFSARTVAGPGPNLRFGQIAVPEVQAKVLTVPVRINAINKEAMTKLLRSGRVNSIEPGSGAFKGQTIKVTDKNRLRIVLKIGDQIHRWLANGDIVLVNRQPTLQKESIKAMEVVISPGLTYRISLADTSSLNADFDGDEINIHVPQTLEAIAEARELMHSHHCILNEQSGKVMSAPTFDALNGGYVLTSDDTRIDPDLFNDITMVITATDGLPTLAARLRAAGVPRFSGKALFSAILPPTFYYVKGKVIIINGILRQGTITKEHAGTAHNSIGQALYKDYGRERAVQFITDMPFIVDRFLAEQGFSVGLGDCYLKDPGLNQVEERERSEIMDRIGMTLVNNLEDKIRSIEIESTPEALRALMRDTNMDSAKKQLDDAILDCDNRIIQLQNEILVERFERVVEIKRTEIYELQILKEQNIVLRNTIEQGEMLAKQAYNAIQDEIMRLPEYKRQLKEAWDNVDTNALASYNVKHAEILKSREGTHRRALQEQFTEMRMAIEALGATPEDPFQAERHEAIIVGKTNVAKNTGEVVSTQNMSQKNPFNIMSDSGSKGTKVNTAQITTALFQQFSNGRIFKYTLDNDRRCLPYFAVGDLNPRARGFCERSFLAGLRVDEFVFHGAASREGLMDTAIKTAETGHLHHSIVKALEDTVVAKDMSVINSRGTIFQFIYGEDSFNAGFLEKINFGGISGDNVIPTFFDPFRLANRINSSYGFIMATIGDETARDEEEEVDKEALDFADLESGLDIGDD